ncbi:MAG: flavin reductase family protein [Anaerolineales bacterium]|nr:flavin reductase family protein [Anaerolineales bacterium]
MTDDTIKEVLKRIPYGFYAITSRSGDDVNAMVANWVMQTSFSPRQVALGLEKVSYTYGLIEKGGVFAINIFLKDGADALKPFMKGRSKNPDKMKDIQYSEGPETGSPILESAAAYLEYRVVRIVDTGGDHDTVIGEVVAAGVSSPGEVGDTLSLPDLGWSYAG